MAVSRCVGKGVLKEKIDSKSKVTKCMRMVDAKRPSVILEVA